MSAYVARWRVKSKNTGMVFEGTTEECAKFVGLTPEWFKQSAMEFGRCGRGGRYEIEEIYGQPEHSNVSSSELQAIRKWDEFVTPIREKYGIPVYRPGKEGRR